ncbi:hypothetical protein AAFF_G00229960 [Aldrovandia affinis]|uniref:Uncharacterized protein n=1 Tax=Aldrovandia affinis TaxID=143900 RepID=A0AAD7SVS3_9TELE|nr:hypothetical protein AAFF_G00229960 [Aldrovandia affinis]
MFAAITTAILRSACISLAEEYAGEVGGRVPERRSWDTGAQGAHRPCFDSPSAQLFHALQSQGSLSLDILWRKCSTLHGC